MAADVNDSAGEAFAAQHPGRVVFVHCDTRRRGDLETAIAAATSLGAFTAMFCNAGVASALDNLDDALENWESLLRVVDINVNACALGTFLALKAGSLVFVSLLQIAK